MCFFFVERVFSLSFSVFRGLYSLFRVIKSLLGVLEHFGFGRFRVEKGFLVLLVGVLGNHYWQSRSFGFTGLD